MSTLLKDIYSKDFIEHFCKDVEKIVLNFDRNQFVNQIFTQDWEIKELKQRMKHIAHVLRSFLDDDFKNACIQIKKIIEVHTINRNDNGFNFACMFYPEIISEYGLDDFETSVNAMEEITKFTSCEFAVRHFLLRYPENMKLKMIDWSKHPHAFVRRLSSEGIRTRLPWAIKVEHLFLETKTTWKILENLIHDENSWVLKSVANNLNDLSKDFPELVLAFVQKYLQLFPEKKSIFKHALRTLLKKGNTEALKIFDFKKNDKLEIIKFTIENKEVKLGENLNFKVEIKNKCVITSFDVRIEYKIYFKRMDGSHFQKVFMISEKKMEKNSTLKIAKKHSFRPITTRKYYSGVQYISIVLNGIEIIKNDFRLLMN